MQTLVTSNFCAHDSSRSIDATLTTSSLYLPSGSPTFRISFSNPKFCRSKSQKWLLVQTSINWIVLPALVASLIQRPQLHLRRGLVSRNSRQLCLTLTHSRLKTTLWRRATCSRVKWTDWLILLAQLAVNTLKCSTLPRIQLDQLIFQTCIRIFCFQELHLLTRFLSQNSRMLRAVTSKPDLGTTARF